MLPRVAAAEPVLTLSWLVRLRWGAVGGQMLTIVIASQLFGVPLPVAALELVVALTVASNLLLLRRLERPTPPTEGLIGAVIVVDVLLLTVMLALSGGAANPFTPIYLVHVTLAVVLLGTRWGWRIVALSMACSGLLFFVHLPLAGVAPAGPLVDSMLLRGLWLAFAVTAVVIAYFVGETIEELRARDADIRKMHEQIARTERLTSLTTLAAGAAHELGTPLATIAVVAKELERSAAQIGSQGHIAEDAKLIREQVERCRGILVQMSAKAGEAAGELPGPVDPKALVADVLEMLPLGLPARLDVTTIGDAVTVPRRALVQVLSSLVRNAFDASPAESRVELRVEPAGDVLRFSVRDRGSGMPPEVLARAGDPFFSTKPPGRGMGLGLFLARAFAEGHGGTFHLESEAGKGTLATVSLPREREPRHQDGPSEAAAA